METYETPEILASFEVEEIVDEAAVCTGGYGGNDWPWFNFFHR